MEREKSCRSGVILIPMTSTYQSIAIVFLMQQIHSPVTIQLSMEGASGSMLQEILQSAVEARSLEWALASLQMLALVLIPIHRMGELMEERALQTQSGFCMETK